MKQLVNLLPLFLNLLQFHRKRRTRQSLIFLTHCVDITPPCRQSQQSFTNEWHSASLVQKASNRNNFHHLSPSTSVLIISGQWSDPKTAPCNTKELGHTSYQSLLIKPRSNRSSTNSPFRRPLQVKAGPFKLQIKQLHHIHKVCQKSRSIIMNLHTSGLLIGPDELIKVSPT